jgi:hypothetical protein
MEIRGYVEKNTYTTIDNISHKEKMLPKLLSCTC